MPDALLHWIASYGVPALFVLLLLGVFGLPVPDETLLTFAGVLIRQGRLHFATTWVASVVGSMCGITLSYVLGRQFGPAAVTHFGGWFHVKRSDLDRVERWLERSGKWTLTFGYFVPGVRHLTALVAGSSQLPPRVFAVYAYSGAAFWCSVFIALGWIMGSQWRAALAMVQHNITVATVAVALAIAIYIVFHRRVRGRRGEP